MFNTSKPLADRMRPKNLGEFVGQNDLVGRGKIISVLLRQDKIPSLIFWGPPGCGKTSLAKIIANETKSRFIFYSAVEVGVNEIKNEVKAAKESFNQQGKKTILCIDEIHRWNKSQQAYLLPHVEDGTLVLIGATTENPSFEVIGPLLSRTKVLTLNRLDEEDITNIIKTAIKDKENGLGKYNVQITNDALKLLLEASNGDSRTVLNALEIACDLTRRSSGKRVITERKIIEALGSKKLLYDKNGEEHYNTISAFIKSLRGSDPDAAIYYLARMLEAGEDPKFIARRMIILASEDVGNADPKALTLAVSTAQAVEFVGLPEASLNLAQAATYLASTPKSNSSYIALKQAGQDVKRTLNEPVPLHLRNPVTKLMKTAGYGRGYKYAHDYSGGFVNQQFLPDKLIGQKYYKPKEIGYEAYIKKHLQNLPQKN